MVSFNNLFKLIEYPESKILSTIEMTFSLNPVNEETGKLFIISFEKVIPPQ